MCMKVTSFPQFIIWGKTLAIFGYYAHIQLVCVRVACILRNNTAVRKQGNVMKQTT